MKQLLLFSVLILLLIHPTRIQAQKAQWVDSVMHHLSLKEQIAQLMVVRVPLNMSEKEQHQFVKEFIKKHEVGGVCFFAGDATTQLSQTRQFQKISDIPLLITTDGEWGLGMRLKDCYSFPRQMLMGALPSEDDELIFAVGAEIGRQCRNMGIHINFAPVVDLNSNPNNPVIGIRSFGEDAVRVGHKGILYMQGMQSEGVMAVAKHFPGHGDTDADSHLGLPVVNHSRKEIFSNDLSPFKAMIDAGVGGVMVAHLQVDALDNRPARPSSLSYPIIKGILRDSLNFQGLVITDGLDMKGVTKYYNQGQGELQALLADNDILLLPPDVEAGIDAIYKAAKNDKEIRLLIERKCRKILETKYEYGLNHLDVSILHTPTEEDWKRCDSIAYQIALRGITLLNNRGWKPGMPVLEHYGTPYKLKPNCDSLPILMAYEDSPVVKRAAQDLLSGKVPFKGRMPVRAAGFEVGDGAPIPVTEVVDYYELLPAAGMDSTCFKEIDALVEHGIEVEAYPGCRLLVAKNGKVVYNRAYGHFTYDTASTPVTLNTMYDLASLTKVTATTIAVMKLVDAGKVKLDDALSMYLPYLKHSNKKKITIREVLSHFARLIAFDSYYLQAQYSDTPKDYILQKIAESKLGPRHKYVYSDFGFILLADMVEQVSGQSLDVFMDEHFYKPMGMNHTSFNPLENGFSIDSVAPTELDNTYRHRLVQGTVHDQNADAMGGVSGHAGLFSTADDIAKLYIMLLNGGQYDGVQYLSKEVITMFNCRYYSLFGNRRALGFDKPLINSPSTHVSPAVSQSSFGHTGFTGTMIWADPKEDLLYIFFSNRVYPNATPNKLAQMNIRTDIQTLIYQSLQSAE